MATVRLNEVIAKMNLENLTPQIDVTKIRIRSGFGSPISIGLLYR